MCDGMMCDGMMCDGVECFIYDAILTLDVFCFALFTSFCSCTKVVGMAVAPMSDPDGNLVINATGGRSTR